MGYYGNSGDILDPHGRPIEPDDPGPEAWEAYTAEEWERLAAEAENLVRHFWYQLRHKAVKGGWLDRWERLATKAKARSDRRRELWGVAWIEHQAAQIEAEDRADSDYDPPF